MASRSRLIPRLTVAALPLIALVSGCQTGGQKAFHYSGTPGEKIMTSEVAVEIGDDCHGTPEKAVIEVDDGSGKPNPREQVLWHITPQPGDRVVITGKAAAAQDPANPVRGASIHDLFQAAYVIPPSLNAIPSGKPNNASPLLRGKDSVVWKYNIEFYRGGTKRCAYDPEICIQRLGSNGCGTTTSADQ